MSVDPPPPAPNPLRTADAEIKVSEINDAVAAVPSNDPVTPPLTPPLTRREPVNCKLFDDSTYVYDPESCEPVDQIEEPPTPPAGSVTLFPFEIVSVCPKIVSVCASLSEVEYPNAVI